MSSQTLLEKLQLGDEKNLLLQGLPLAIEKQFIKLSFSKNVTPLLKIRKIDFALVFAFSQKQLREILKEVIPALHSEAKFWIAYPKASSKITSDLCRDANWDFITEGIIFSSSINSSTSSRNYFSYLKTRLVYYLNDLSNL